MHCASIHELLTDFLLDELDAGQAKSVRQHLAGCDDCRMVADEIRATLDLLRTAMADNPATPDKLP
ncbi:MAG: anti-sigma factor, partial [Kiritimatiellia bacterium]